MGKKKKKPYNLSLVHWCYRSQFSMFLSSHCWQFIWCNFGRNIHNLFYCLSDASVDFVWLSSLICTSVFFKFHMARLSSSSSLILEKESQRWLWKNGKLTCGTSHALTNKLLFPENLIWERTRKMQFYCWVREGPSVRKIILIFNWFWKTSWEKRSC